MFRLVYFLACFFCPFIVFSNPDTIPPELTSRYRYDSVRMWDYGSETDGFWLIEPAAPIPDSAHVVVFHHGYGAINPMVYGRWFRHLARQGNIIIFPRYQRNLLRPAARKFPSMAAKAIRDALDTLRSGNHVRPLSGPLIMVGHSYGGAISAFLGVRYKEYGIPQPEGLLLCAAGTGPLRAARLRSYEAMPENTRMLIVINDQDKVVGDRFQERIFRTAIHTPYRNLIRQYPDADSPGISAHHNECCSLDETLDNGLRNATIKRSYRHCDTNALDYYGYWKLLDALMDCTRRGENCQVAFGNTQEQQFLGKGLNGNPIRPLQITLPQQK